MRAAWYEMVGPAKDVLIIGELPTPQPGRGEVRVRVHMSGVNPSDVKARAGARGAIPFPKVIPHSDGAGVIEAVGADVDADRIGERVWIWNAAWQRPFGTCAEFVCLPAIQAVALPVSASFEVGACLGIPASTAAWGVFADGDVAGQTILVTGGAGAVGHYAVQLAKWGGANVLATVSGAAKAAHAKSAGADTVINYRDEDVATAVCQATGGKGVDRIVEVEFGGNLAVSNAILRPGGTIATYGSMAAAMPELPFYPMMFNGTTIRMFLVYLLAGKQRERIIDLVNGAIDDSALTHAIAARQPLAEVASLHLLVEAGTLIGNAVVEIG